MIIPCEQRGCCYSKDGGTTKCTKCDTEYKEEIARQHTEKEVTS